MVHLDYRDSRPIYAQIIDGFKEQITGGALKPGDKLPSVRELASALAVVEIDIVSPINLAFYRL